MSLDNTVGDEWDIERFQVAVDFRELDDLMRGVSRVFDEAGVSTLLMQVTLCCALVCTFAGCERITPDDLVRYCEQWTRQIATDIQAKHRQ